MNLNEILEHFGKKIVKTSLANLTQKGKIDTGALYSSVEYSVDEPDPGEPELSFKMKDYGKFVDKGVSGLAVKRKTPYSYGSLSGNGDFLTSLKAWCLRHGMEEGFAYYIRKRIFLEGIKPTYWFTKAYNKEIKDIDKAIDEWMEELDFVEDDE